MQPSSKQNINDKFQILRPINFVHVCGRRVAGENFKHRITVHVQLYYSDGLTIRWEN